MTSSINYPNFKEVDKDAEAILCLYANSTNQIQIIRISNVINFYYERVVFPGQRLMFETSSEALLEVFTGSPVETLLFDRILCDRLRVSTTTEPQQTSFSSLISQ